MDLVSPACGSVWSVRNPQRGELAKQNELPRQIWLRVYCVELYDYLDARGWDMASTGTNSSRGAYREQSRKLKVKNTLVVGSLRKGVGPCLGDGFLCVMPARWRGRRLTEYHDIVLAGAQLLGLA